MTEQDQKQSIACPECHGDDTRKLQMKDKGVYFGLGILAMTFYGLFRKFVSVNPSLGVDLIGIGITWFALHMMHKQLPSKYEYLFCMQCKNRFIPDQPEVTKEEIKKEFNRSALMIGGGVLVGIFLSAIIFYIVQKKQGL